MTIGYDDRLRVRPFFQNAMFFRLLTFFKLRCLKQYELSSAWKKELYVISLAMVNKTVKLKDWMKRSGPEILYYFLQTC